MGKLQRQRRYLLSRQVRHPQNLQEKFELQTPHVQQRRLKSSQRVKHHR
jgi:hypothetical protein